MITVIGSINMDMTFLCPEIPRVGETVLGTEYFQNCGGKGANQAVAAARMGSRVTMVGAVGKDGVGDALLEALAMQKVDVSLVKRGKCGSGIAAISVDANGRNNIIVIPGSNNEVVEADVAAMEPMLARSTCVLLQCEIPLKTVEYALRTAKQLGVLTILNPAPACELSDGILKNTDILVPNEHELARIVGMPTDSEADCLAAAHALAKHGIPTVLVTRGEHGVLCLTDGEERTYPAYHVQAVDTTAAGDAFLGGLASALDERLPLTVAIERGQRVAAYAVQHFGAQQSYPMREEVP